MITTLNPKIEKYLHSLDLPSSIEERVRDIVRAFRFLCRGAEIERLFLSDICDDNGREFVSVWGFAGPYWMEAREFYRQNDIDISPYTHSIMYLGIESENLSLLGHASDDSRMSIEVETTKVRYSTLSATGKNCDELIAIVAELLLPNLMVTPPSGRPPAQKEEA